MGPVLQVSLPVGLDPGAVTVTVVVFAGWVTVVVLVGGAPPGMAAARMARERMK